MSETKVVLEIDNSHFTVRLYESMLKIDLKDTDKNELRRCLKIHHSQRNNRASPSHIRSIAHTSKRHRLIKHGRDKKSQNTHPLSPRYRHSA